MKIFVTAKPNAMEAKVEEVDATHFVVRVVEPPVDGRANMAIIKILAEHFSAPPTMVRIISGHTSRQKIVEIL